MVRRHLGAAGHAGLAGAPQCSHGLGRREVQQVQGVSLVGGEREVALDHHGLGHRGIAGEAELGGDGALVHVAVARQRRLLAVQREWASGDGGVLQCAPHQAGFLSISSMR